MVQKWIENQFFSTPLEAAGAGKQSLDASDGAKSSLFNTIQEQERMNSLSPKDREKSHNIEEKLHTLMKSQDVVQLNQMLRDPNLKQFISQQLQREIFAELRSINMDKVRGNIRDGNMGAVTEEMSGRLHEVRKGYGDIFQQLARELEKPNVLIDDRETIEDLMDEVQEAETMVDQLLASISNLPQAVRDTPPETKQREAQTNI